MLDPIEACTCRKRLPQGGYPRPVICTSRSAGRNVSPLMTSCAMLTTPMGQVDKYRCVHTAHNAGEPRHSCRHVAPLRTMSFGRPSPRLDDNQDSA
jgi:hypothetical protein